MYRPEARREAPKPHIHPLRTLSDWVVTDYRAWLAYSGEHDGADGHATLVFVHAPENDHTGAGGAHPPHWFVRNDPFAAVAPSFTFHDELVLAPGATLTRRYRVLVADGVWDRERITAQIAELPW